MEKKYGNLDDDYAIVCKNCGHINEMHDHDEYEGTSCIGDCTCTDFDSKTDEKGNVIYDLD